MIKLEEVVKTAWNKTKENIRAKRYFHWHNYLTDLVAGNISRTPLYFVTK